MIKSSFSKFLAVAALAGVLATTTVSAQEHKHSKPDLSKLPAAAAKQGVTYAGDIKAILDKSCVKCHGAERPKARLNLTTLATTLKGGEDGKVIEPGQSTKSGLLISVARIGDEEEWMPPKNNKAKIEALTKEEVALIRAWIDQGAK